MSAEQGHGDFLPDDDKSKIPPLRAVYGLMAMRPLTLILLDDTFAVCRLESAAYIPTWATASEFLSITRTTDELSIVCRQEQVPAGVRCERDWRCLRVAGRLPFTLVCVLHSLLDPLAEVGVSVFALSTFDTDYVLVKEIDLPTALTALGQQGHTLRE